MNTRASIAAPPRIEFEDILRRAIYDRQGIVVRCQGFSEERLFEPYVLYRSRMGRVRLAGNELVSQRRGAKPVPRVIDLSTVTAVRLSGQRFTPDPQFNPDDPHYQFGIICRV